jgi:hypothetical protein
MAPAGRRPPDHPRRRARAPPHVRARCGPQPRQVPPERRLARPGGRARGRGRWALPAGGGRALGLRAAGPLPHSSAPQLHVQLALLPPLPLPLLPLLLLLLLLPPPPPLLLLLLLPLPLLPLPPPPLLLPRLLLPPLAAAAAAAACIPYVTQQGAHSSILWPTERRPNPAAHPAHPNLPPASCRRPAAAAAAGADGGGL